MLSRCAATGNSCRAPTQPPGRTLVPPDTTVPKAPTTTPSSVYAVMYVGPVRIVRGEKELDANCCLYVGVQLLLPPDRAYWPEVLLLRSRRELGEHGSCGHPFANAKRYSRDGAG